MRKPVVKKSRQWRDVRKLVLPNVEWKPEEPLKTQ